MRRLPSRAEHGTSVHAQLLQTCERCCRESLRFEVGVMGVMLTGVGRVLFVSTPSAAIALHSSGNVESDAGSQQLR